MQTEEISIGSTYRHPRSHAPLNLLVDDRREGRVYSGRLQADGDTFPIVRGVARFCPAENYADNFGYQWETFPHTQLDSKSGWNRWSETRFFEETKWPRDLSGERVLEAGSGMGRFTEILATTGADVWTFDYSTAIDANFRNNGARKNVKFAQADIYQPPYEPASFDRILCLGVIQHCPKPEAAFRSLLRFLKPGGAICIDVYRLSFKSLFMGKYYLRPLTRRLSTRAQHRFVKAHMGWTYPLTSLVHDRLGLRAGRYASMLLGLADFRGLPDFSPQLAREMSELDTLDMLAPRYDYPKTVGTVRRWFERAGLTKIEVHPGYNGVEARGVKAR